MELKANATIRNRFDIEVRNVKTGKIEKYKAHNIILDQMWTRICNFNSYFGYIHFGTGDTSEEGDGFDASRKTLFTHLSYRAVTHVSRSRAIPKSSWQQKIVLLPAEFVGETITELGIGYGTATNSLVTHAPIEDSEGEPIGVTKTDEMQVTIYSTVFIELDTDMYNGQLRWVTPGSSNELINYLTGAASYPNQWFRVTRVPGFDPPYSSGSAPLSHGTSPETYPLYEYAYSWIKNPSSKKVTTPNPKAVGGPRIGIDVGNDYKIRGFGLGSAANRGTVRGHLPITGVCESASIVGEILGAGDGEKTGFNPFWEQATITAVYEDNVLVNPNDYDLVSTKKGTNVLSFLDPDRVLSGNDAMGVFDEDAEPGTSMDLKNNNVLLIDVQGLTSFEIDKLRVIFWLISNSATVQASNNMDMTDSVVLIDKTTESGVWIEAPIAETFRYYQVSGTSWAGNCNLRELELCTAPDQITFHTAPTGTITADYTVPYLPKDSNHVLDLQVSIQFGEGE